MCPATETTSDSLDDKREEQPQEFKMPLIMTIKDHSATASTLALQHVRLQGKHVVVVCFL